MSKTLEIAIILSAVDKASRVLNDVFNKQSDKLKEMQERSSRLMAAGAGMMAAGVGLGASLAPAVSAFSELEDSSIALQNSMTDSMNKVSPLFQQVNDLAIQLGNRLPGTTADFQNMFQVLLNNGVPAQSVLNGVGQSAAYLAVALKMPYEEAAQFAARMRIATGIADEDMNKFFDTLQRTASLGVNVGEMQYAFGRSAGALKLMGIQGLEASKSISALYAMILRGGLSGETTGTGFAAIINGLLDPDKMEKMNSAARELGVSLEFMDSAGQFKGIENFVAQLDKLKGFSAEQRAGVVNALTGGGQDAQMMQTMIQNGLEGYQKLRAEQESKMALDKKVEMQLTSLKNTWEAAMGNMTNALAAFGAALAPTLKVISDLIGKVASLAQEFFTAYPTIAKVIGAVIGLAAVVFTLAGAYYFVSGAFGVAKAGMMLFAMQTGIMTGLTNAAWAAQLIWNSTLMGFPLVWVVAAIAAVIAAIYLLWKNWDTVVAFFKRTWETIKAAFWAGVEAVKKILWDYHPYVLIYRHWDGIVQWFSNMWDKIVASIEALGERFIKAGENIVNSLKQGIENKWEEFKGWWSQKMQGIRDFLPFSPAKVGPLRDIHKLKLMETIAASVKMEPLHRAMTRSTGIAMSAFPRTLATASVGGRGNNYGGTTIVYSPTISFADSGNISDVLKKHSKEIFDLIRAEESRKKRLSYS
jgi:TP901 family phage tail tape measure protein